MHRGGRHTRSNAPRLQPSSDYQTIRVRGWQRSKASSNPDGGVESLLTFLEKKASPPNGPTLQTYDPLVVGDALEVSVKSATADRFLHLDGFTWAGVLLIVEPKGAASRTPSSNNSLDNRISTPSGPRQQNGDRLSHQSQNSSGHRQGRSQMANDGSSNNTSDICDLTPKAPVFHDQGDVAKNFLAAFFPLYDTNREEAIRNFYDDQSTFSLSATTHKRRGTVDRPQTNLTEYIRLSRNLKKVTHPPARAARKSTGRKAIFDMWNSLPKTQHPQLADSANWLFECHPIHNLQHPTDSSTVSGLSINVHGCFQDMDKNGQVDTKSFDRSFILGPGAGTGGIRVISDALVLRPYYPSNKSLEVANLAPAGAAPLPAPQVEAQQPQLAPQLVPPVPAPSPIPAHPEIPPGSDFGQPAPGKTEEQLLKEKMKLELSFNTKMKLAFAEEALASVGWDYAAALGRFKEMHEKGMIPADVFLNV